MFLSGSSWTVSNNSFRTSWPSISILAATWVLRRLEPPRAAGMMRWRTSPFHCQKLSKIAKTSMPLSQSNDTMKLFQLTMWRQRPPQKKISQYVRKKDRQTTTSCNKMPPKKKHMPHPGTSLSYRHTSPLKGLINLISDVGFTANLCCKVPWQCARPCAWSLPARLPNFTTRWSNFQIATTNHNPAWHYRAIANSWRAKAITKIIISKPAGGVKSCVFFAFFNVISYFSLFHMIDIQSTPSIFHSSTKSVQLVSFLQM